MRHHGFMPVPSRNRFVPALWAVVAVLTLGNAVAWWGQRQSTYEASRAVALREAEIANDAFAEETRQMFAQIDLVLRGIRAFYLHSRSVPETERYIQDLQLGPGRIENGYLVDVAGRLVITHNPATVGRSVADRDYFQFHRDHAEDVPYVSRVELGRATGKYLFRVTRRINDADGRFAGVSLVTVAPGSIAEFYARLTHNDGSVATLVSTRDHLVRARVPEPPVEVWARALDTPLWREVAQRPVGRFMANGAIDGVRRHFVYRTIPEWDMVMLTGVPDRLIQANAQQSLLRITVAQVGGNLAVLAFAAVLTYVDRQRKRLKLLATTDGLTGLSNRRELLEHGERELLRAQRYGRPFSLMLIDIDHFKKVNDQFGHASGDRVLKGMARCGQASLRESDLFGRFGGEEFLALLPETDWSGAATLAERLRQGAGQCTDGTCDQGQAIPFTVSIGVAVRGSVDESLDAMIARADAALYRAKAAGRNRVEMAEAAVAP